MGNRQFELRSSGFETGCAQNGPDTSSFGPDNQLVRTFNSCLAQNHYWYDNAGNRLVQLDTSTGGSYLGPQSVQSYTAKGQLFFSLSPTGSVGTYDYNWHWYDATGQRMLTWRTTGFNWAPDSLPAGGIRTYYVYDGNDVALSIHRTGLGAFAVRARYLVGGVDNAVAGRFAGEFTGPKKPRADQRSPGHDARRDARGWYAGGQRHLFQQGPLRRADRRDEIRVGR